MKFQKKIAELIAECAKDFILEEKEQFVVAEITIKNGEISSRKAFLVDSAEEYFVEQKFETHGLKSYIKRGRVNKKFGYIVFESLRLSNTLHTIKTDVENIEKDALENAYS
ncbi:MAG: hypothetical protein ACOCP1_00800 [Campylobacterales bacterium]